MDYKGTKVISLVRVSTQDQAEDDRAGIPAQQESVGRIIERYELDCVDTVVLTNVSGTATFQCPDILRLLQRLASYEVGGIVITRMDRLLRPDKYGDFALLGAIQSSGALIFDETGVIDLSSDHGFLSAGFNALFAGQEIRTFKRRVSAGKEIKRRKGECPTGQITLPLGVTYIRDPKLLEAEQHLGWNYTPDVTRVIDAFERYNNGEDNLSKLGKIVGIQPRTLADILRNPIYMGYRTYSEKRGNDKYIRPDGRQADRKKVPRPSSEVISIKVFDKPAVSKALFDNVQARLAEKSSRWRTPRSSSEPTNLGSGILFCARCGSRIYCSSGKRNDRKGRGYYFCSENNYLKRRQGHNCAAQNVRQEIMDQLLMKLVNEKMSDTEWLTQLVSTHPALTRHSEVADQSKQIYSGLKAIQARKSRLVDLYEKKGIEFDMYMERLQKLAAEEDALRKIPKQDQSPFDLVAMVTALVRGALAFNRLSTLSERKTVLRQIFSKILVDGPQVVGCSLHGLSHADDCRVGTHTGTGSSPPPA